MKKHILNLLILFFTVSKTYSQTNFNIGFSDGYQVGYCYSQSYGCIPPIPPIAPIIGIYESSDNYMDGYNRGLLRGASAWQKAEQKSNATKINPYGQPQLIPKITPFKPNYDFYSKALNQAEQNYQQKEENEQKKRDEKREKIIKEIKELNSPENVRKKQEYINLLKLYYNSFKSFPKTIPNGMYNVTITIEPQVGWENGIPHFRENIVAIVENNKIISYRKLREDGTYEYVDYVEKFPIKSMRQFRYYIIESSTIINGIGKIRGALYAQDDEQSQGETITEDGLHKVYLLEYIEMYQNAQNCIKEIKKQYASLTKYPKVQDGWHVVKANDGKDFCDTRNVYVQNGKITMYKTGKGKDYTLTSGGSIVNCKSTISYIATNEDGSDPITMIAEIYFL